MMHDDITKRIDTLERIVVRSVAGVGALTTAVGMLFPLWSEEDTDSGLVTVRLVTAPFEAFGSTDSVMDSNKSALVMLGIGFAVLVLVQIGCLWLFARAWRRDGDDRVRRVGGWLAGLSAVGSCVPLLMWLAVPGADDATRGPAIWPMIVGVVLAVMLVAGTTLPTLWRHD